MKFFSPADQPVRDYSLARTCICLGILKDYGLLLQAGMSARSLSSCLCGLSFGGIFSWESRVWSHILLVFFFMSHHSFVTQFSGNLSTTWEFLSFFPSLSFFNIFLFFLIFGLFYFTGLYIINNSIIIIHCFIWCSYIILLC